MALDLVIERARKIGTALVVAIQLAPTDGLSAQIHDKHSCDKYTWSEPTILRGPGSSGVYVESPQILVHRDTLWLIGSPTWAWKSPGKPISWKSGSSRTTNLAGLRVPILSGGELGIATAINLPFGVRHMSTPRAAFDREGALDVLWESGPTTSAAPSVNRVWSSRLMKGEWSSPTIFIKPQRRVTWIGSNISEVAKIGGVPHVFAPISLDDSLIVIRLENSGWSKKTVPFINHIYSGIANIEGDSGVFVTYVRNHSLYAGRFDLSSGKLSHTTVVASFPTGAIVQPHPIATRTSGRFVVWLESSTDREIRWFLKIAESKDHGGSWEIAPPQEVKSGVGALSVASDTQGRIHAVIDGPPHSPSSPVHFVWGPTGWHGTQLPRLKGLVVPSPTVAPWTGQSIAVVWAMAESQRAAPVTYWAIGTPCGQLTISSG